MSIIKSAVIAASLVAVAAVSANAQSREDLNSGYHGNSPVYSSPYGPRDEIDQAARDAYGQAGVRAPWSAPAPRYQQRYRSGNGSR